MPLSVPAGVIQPFIEGNLFRYRQAWWRGRFQAQLAAFVIAPLTLAAVLTGMFFYGFTHVDHFTAKL